MSFITQTNSGNTILINAEQDGALNHVLAKDIIFQGIGDEFEVTYSSSSLGISVGSGEGVIGGRTIRADASNTITLSASSVIYLVLRIDLTQTYGNEGMLYALTSLASMQTDDLNSGGTKRDMLLATITTNGSGVTNLVDNRDIRDSIFLSGTTLPVSGKEGDIFFLYEE